MAYLQPSVPLVQSSVQAADIKWAKPYQKSYRFIFLYNGTKYWAQNDT